MTVLEIKGLRAGVDGKEILQGIDLTVRSGEVHAVTATVNVTYNDGSTGNLSAVSLAATRPASFMQPLNSYVPAAQSGLYIRAVNSVTLSATTGTTGSFGVTATKPRMTMPLPLANKAEVFDWAALGMPEILNSSCLFGIVLTSQTNTGSLRGGGKIAHC